MSVKSNQYISQITQDTSRGPSQAIWGDCPVSDFYQGQGGGIGTAGIIIEDDFTSVGSLTTNAAGSFGRWASYANTNAIVDTDPNAEGGVLAIGAGSNNNVGIAIGSQCGSMRLVSGATNYPYGQKLWFECRVAMGSIAASKRDLFIGLCDSGTSTLTASAGVWSAADTFVTTLGLIGFNARGGATNPGDFGLIAQASGQTLQRFTNLATLATTVVGTAPAAYAAVTNGAPTGFIKLGFVFDPTPGNPTLAISSASTGQTAGVIARPVVKVFVNGQQAAAFLTNTNAQAATFPPTWLGPLIAYRSDSATAPGDFYIDWFRVAQLASI